MPICPVNYFSLAISAQSWSGSAQRLDECSDSSKTGIVHSAMSSQEQKSTLQAGPTIEQTGRRFDSFPDTDVCGGGS